MDFGLMFFFSADWPAARDKYGLLIDAAKFADDHGFCCIWTPERHFHQFGGLFPNPAVTSAALATITRRLQIRAGSLISPLHDVIRIVEEWSMVDNLSNGRVAISFWFRLEHQRLCFLSRSIRLASGSDVSTD